MQNQWFVRRIAFVAGFLACSIPVIYSAAAPWVLFEQLPGNNSHAKFVSNGPGEPGNPGVRTADDVQFESQLVVTRIEWWGEFNTGVATDFTFTFYEDSLSRPGNIVHSTSGSLESSVMNVGSSFDPVTLYASNLTAPFSASPNQRYWLSIFNAAPGVRWEWLQANATTNGSMQLSALNPMWVPSFSEGDLSMRLIGIPEPSTLLLLSLTAIGILAIRRR